MDWIVFSYSLPSKSSSSPRVALWRRLRRLGAISPAGGINVLPAQNESIEAFQWLAQEVRQAKGQAVVMHVQQFEGLTDQELIELFREARQEDYAEIATQAAELEKAITSEMDVEEQAQIQESLAKLQRQYADIARIDYFDCPEGTVVAAQLAKISQALFPSSALDPHIETAAIDAYKDKQWVTRPKPHVDRLATVWLIRRFINPEAIIRYSVEPEPGEITFDMEGAEFGHVGNLCTFETVLRAFNLEIPDLSIMAEIIHEIDLRDERYLHPEADGIDAILRGWLLLNLSDAELEARGLALFDGLYEMLSTRSQTKLS